MSIICWKAPNKLPKEFCEFVIASSKWDGARTADIKDSATGEYVVNKTKRITDVLWEDESSYIGCVTQTYLQMANSLNSWNFVLSGMEKVQLARYGIGGHYDWHVDGSQTGAEQIRKLSMVILLSDPSTYEGGVLEFANVDEQPVLEQGDMIIFPSYIGHRVTPVISGVRYSASAWAFGPAFR